VSGRDLAAEVRAIFTNQQDARKRPFEQVAKSIRAPGRRGQNSTARVSRQRSPSARKSNQLEKRERFAFLRGASALRSVFQGTRKVSDASRSRQCSTKQD
jgi:hypothetical protein